jgi:uncharacterized protein
MSRRETAWRVTTRELMASVHEERGEGDRAASYLLSPYGARMNRVVLAGAISAAEPLGRDDPPTFWRARLDDPLGSVAVTAGSFQPRAMVQLRRAPVGGPALVVGKVHLYRGRDGSATVSVRAEAVRPISEAEERATLAEVARQTLDRLDTLERLAHEPATTEAELRAAGTVPLWAQAARQALHRYPDADRASYREALAGVVRRVAATGPAPPPRPATVTVSVDPPPRVRPPTSDADRTEETTFLDLVDAVAESSVDGYADVRVLFRQLADRGVGAEQAEAVLGRLEEGGVVEEPVVGKLRRA